MTCVAPTAEMFPSRYAISRSGAIALVVAALGVAAGVAAWATNPVTWVSDLASSKDINAASFEFRFVSARASNLLSADFSRPLVLSLPSEIEIKFQLAKDQLAQKLQSQGWRVATMEQPASSSVTSVPLPRPRPVEANLDSRDSPLTAQTDNRTLLQKLPDLIPARSTSLSSVDCFECLR